MTGILRLVFGNQIQDYDLKEKESKISLGGFLCFPEEDQWRFKSDSFVYVNGNKQNEGILHTGDMIIIDQNHHLAAMVLEDIPNNPQKIEFSGSLSIGRKDDNQLVIKNSLISGSHCRIIEDKGQYFIQDLGSTNGTYVGYERIREKVLNKGDIIHLGCYRLMVSDGIILLNCDARVSGNGVTFVRKTSATRVLRTPVYPWFSPAPRVFSPLSTLNINIEDAPTVAQSPTMRMGAIALDPTMLAISLGMQALRFGIGKVRYSKQEKRRAEVYAAYLTEIEKELRDHGEAQRKISSFLHPGLNECISRAKDRKQNLWEKHKGDDDFLTLRLGKGTVPAKAVINIPNKRLQLKEDPMDKVPLQIKEKYSVVSDVVVSSNLIKDGNIGLIGNRRRLIDLCRSFIIQLSALHSYEEVRIAVLYPEEEKSLWEFARWLPHCYSKDRSIRYVACKKDCKYVLSELDEIVKKRIEAQNQWNYGKGDNGKPHYVFIVANSELLMNTSIGTALMMNQPDLGVSGIFLGNSMSDFPHSIRNIVEYQDKIVLKSGDFRQEVEPDSDLTALSSEICDSYARSLAPVRLLGGQAGKQGLPSSISLFDGLHIENIKDIEIRDMWAGNSPEISLAVPIGIKPGGDLFYFDIHQNAHGPHGMVAGGTGSGKSQLAQTWIISMALQFSPKDVQFVLVDFKGESLLQPFLNLPHLAGSISNLDKDVARSFKAMESELQRRQRILSDYECPDIIAYQKRAKMDSSMPALPYIILVVDEFAEFKQQFPDFTAPLDHLYRGGRSLGLFVVLMTQAPAGIVTDQMRANANFRWCLSVRSDADSREMIGTTEASELKLPGRVYIKTKDSYDLVQSFYSGCPYNPDKADEAGKTIAFSVDTNGERLAGMVTKKKVEGRKTQLEVLVDYISTFCERNHIPAAKPLWTRELPMVSDLFGISKQGSVWEDISSWKKDSVYSVFGIVDDPDNQTQFEFIHEFEKDGNLAVYGIPYCGKTTFLQTGIISMCNRYSPEEIQFYLLDVGGFGLRTLERFPHVGVASGDDELEIVEKEITLLLDILKERKKLFRRESVSSYSGYETATGEKLPVCVLVVDNLNLLSLQMPALFDSIVRISREGSTYGLYLMCSFAGISGINFQLTQNIKTQVALQLPDKADYTSIVGRVSEGCEEILGRGMIKTQAGPKKFQTAIAFGEMPDNERFMKLRNLADSMNSVYSGKRPETVKIMPEDIDYGDLSTVLYTLGLDMTDISPVVLGRMETLSLLISDGNGKAGLNLLSLICREACEEKDSKVLIYTDRKKAFTEADNVTFVSNPADMEKLVNEWANELRRRQSVLRDNPDALFSPILIAIDHYYDMIKNAVGDLIPRLEVFIRLGQNLGITVVGLDLAPQMSKARFEGDLLTQTMRKGAIVLSGGTITEHQITDTYTFSSNHPRPMKEDECGLIRDNTIVFFKEMQPF